LFEVPLYSGGILGKEIAQQPQVVLDGAADIAFVVPGYTPDRFPDNSVLELPGLLSDMREATLVYAQLLAVDALKGYGGFFVIGAFVTKAESIHSRVPINSIRTLPEKNESGRIPLRARIRFKNRTGRQASTRWGTRIQRICVSA
jgi:TRAP-type C4-dicarboxylate transport system substrate-binding protein